MSAHGSTFAGFEEDKLCDRWTTAYLRKRGPGSGQGAVQLIVLQHERAESGELCPRRRELSGELVGVQLRIMEKREVAPRLWQGTAELVGVEVERL